MTGGSSAIARELKTINPETEEVINTYKMMTKEQINEKVKKAQNAFVSRKKIYRKELNVYIM
jgi:acyl-CoA reductase-like NAD-dependent aldehyde dehydrogenase